MQSIRPSIFFLTLFVCAVTHMGYAQARVSIVAAVLRSTDSVEMLANGPRNFLSLAIGKKIPLFSVNKNEASSFRGMAESKFTGTAVTIALILPGVLQLSKDPFIFTRKVISGLPMGLFLPLAPVSIRSIIRWAAF